MAAPKSIQEPLLGEDRADRKPSAIGKVRITPRAQLGAVKVHTSPRKSDEKTADDYESEIASLSEEVTSLTEELKAAYARIHALQEGRKRIFRKVEAINARTAEILEGDGPL